MAMAGAGAGSLAIGSAMIMAGTPPAKAGNAAAIEETAYDLGNVLGVAILGSVASLVYRQAARRRRRSSTTASPHPSAPPPRTRSVPPPRSPRGRAARRLADQAGVAFTDALAMTSLIGGLVMIAVAVVVLLTAPRGLDISQQQH